MIIDTNNYINNYNFKNENEYIHNVLNLKRFKTKKIAILYSGNIRSFSRCLENQKKFLNYIKRDYGNDSFDIFYQKYKNEIMHINKDMFTDGIETNSELNFGVDENYNDNLYCSLYQYICQIKGYYDIFQFLLEYQFKNNIYYKYIIRMRYDHEIYFINDSICADFNSIQIKNFLHLGINDDNTITCPFTGCCAKIENYKFNDRFFYGKQYNMFYPMNCIYFMNNNYLNNKIHAETYVGSVIKNNNLKINYFRYIKYEKLKIYPFYKNYPENIINIFSILDKNLIKISFSDLFIFIKIVNMKIKINCSIDIKKEEDILFIKYMNEFFQNNFSLFDKYYDMYKKNEEIDYILINIIAEYLLVKFIKTYFDDIYPNFFKLKIYTNHKFILNDIDMTNVEFYIKNSNDKNFKYYKFLKFLEKNVNINPDNESHLLTTFEEIDDFGNKETLYVS